MENQSDMNPKTETLINAFCEITSTGRKEALFYLESHNFDMDSAVTTYMDANHPVPASAAINAQSPSESENPSSDRSRSRSVSPDHSSQQPQRAYNLRSSEAKSVSHAGGSSTGRRSGRIHTFSDLNRQATEGSGSDSDNPQEYYTGGEKSGMLVQDPSKLSDVDDLFRQARQSQPAGGPVENIPPPSSRSFVGTARRLTGETIPSTPQQPEAVTHTITFWRNGFTVDEGPLRRLDDPANRPFLESIRNSECPLELQPSDRRTAVHVSLIRKDENCPAQERRQTPFHGVGRTLASSSANAEDVKVELTPLTAAPAVTAGLSVDQSRPSTSIQLRLADGTRMVSRFNTHHTVRDIRGFIDASRPGAPRTYQLQTVGFPPKQLTDLEMTIEQAGLANSVIIQRV